MRALMVVVLVLAGCSGADDAPAGPVASDALGMRACRHFVNVLDDVEAGVLTDAEVRAKFQEVRKDAQVSDVPGLAEAATELVAAFTREDTAAIRSAADRMADVCVGVAEAA